jgi:alkylhydroperoxidase family enzyme
MSVLNRHRFCRRQSKRPQHSANRHLSSYRTDFNFSELERLVLEYADAMTRTPVEVSDALFAKVREKFNEAELVELTSGIAWENYRARFDHAFGIEAENFTDGAVCALPVRTAG